RRKAFPAVPPPGRDVCATNEHEHTSSRAGAPARGEVTGTRMKIRELRNALGTAALAALLLGLAPARLSAGGARITVVNTNEPNVGFNDPTPAAPVGGNTGTTVGAQRLIAFQRAADIWGSLLDSAVEIRIQASF